MVVALAVLLNLLISVSNHPSICSLSFFVDSVLFFFVFAQSFDLDGNGFFLYSFFFTRKYCIILQKVFEITCLNRINEMKCNAIEI